MPQKLAHPQNKPDMLVTVSIELESPGSSEIPQVCLERVCWHADDMHHPRSGVDVSDGHIDRLRGLVDDLRGWMDALNVSNKPEMANMSCGDNTDTYLGAGDTKHVIDTMDGFGSQTDASSGLWDTTKHQNTLKQAKLTCRGCNAALKQAKWLQEPCR